MKTTTMLWLGAAAVAGYYLYKNRGALATTTAPQAIASQAMTAANTPIVVIEDDYDYPAGWVWSGPSWGWGGPRRRGGHHHHGGGGHRGRR